MVVSYLRELSISLPNDPISSMVKGFLCKGSTVATIKV